MRWPGNRPASACRIRLARGGLLLATLALWVGRVWPAADAAALAQAQAGPPTTSAGALAPRVGRRPSGMLDDLGSMALGDLVWQDHDHDGLQGAGESPIRGVRIELWCGSPATVLATAVSSSEGHYAFTDSLLADPDPADDVGHVEGGIPRSAACELRMPLLQDALHISVTLADAPQPANGGLPATDNHPLTDVADSDARVEGPDALIRITTAAAGEANLGLDFGLIGTSTSTHTPTQTDTPTSSATPTPSPTPTATPTSAANLNLGDRVFFDQDGDGLFEPLAGDSGIDGVLLQLYEDDGDGRLDTGDGLPVASAVSAGGGAYLFSGPLPGSYLVEVAPANFDPFSPLQGLLSSGGQVPAADPDDDRDHDDNGDPVSGFGIASQAISLALGTEPIDDGDADPNSNRSLDFGFAFPATPTDEPTLSPTPTLTPTPTRTPTPTPVTYCLGDRLFNDLDNDGRFEPSLGEMGIDGVPLEIYLDDGDGLLVLPDDLLVQQGTTEPDGHYGACFTAAGPYIVAIPATAFAAGEALAGAMTSTGNEVSGMAPDPDDDVDHDDNGTLMPDGRVVARAITLAAGTEPDVGADGDGSNGNQTLDFGFHFAAGSTATPTADATVPPTATPALDATAAPTATQVAVSTVPPTATPPPLPSASPSATVGPLCLGDRLFLDLDKDGRFEPSSGEFGIDEALLLLYRDDGDGLLDGDDGPPIAATRTADEGRYAFCQLPPGDYIVALPAGDFAPGQLLAGLASSNGNDQAGQAPDPDDDVDQDDNGALLASGDVASKAVTLAAGTEPDPASDGDGTHSNHTVDLGLIKPAPPTGLLFGGLEVSAEGDGLTAAIRWQTLMEQGLLGFRVERANSVAGPWTALSGGRLIVAEDVRAGARYATTDRPGSSGRFHYRVVAVAADGTESRFGPAGIALEPWLPLLRPSRLYLPLLARQRPVVVDR